MSCMGWGRLGEVHSVGWNPWVGATWMRCMGWGRLGEVHGVRWNAWLG